MKMIALLFFSLTLINCSSQNEKLITRLDGTSISKDSLTAQLDQLLIDAEVAGLAITVFNENKPVYKKAFGYKDQINRLPLTDSTNIYGASLSKAVFSVLVMDLVEDGILNLDRPLQTYLPKKIYEYEPQTRWHDDYSALKEDSLYDKITARMCLAHTSGFANWRTAESALSVLHKPGTKHMYSGEGFVYLQVVIEKITGKGLEQLAQERIFKPLHMNNSSFQWKSKFENDFSFGHDHQGNPYDKDKDNEPRSASTLETTASDYTKFLEGVLSKRLITEKSYNEIFSPQIKVLEPTSSYEGPSIGNRSFDSLEVHYGLGWGYLDTPYGRAVFKGGNGSGFQHYSVLFPDAGKGVLIMTNSRNGRKIFKKILSLTLKDTFSTLKVASIQCTELQQHYIQYFPNDSGQSTLSSKIS